jgi:methionine-gamma-lyase
MGEIMAKFTKEELSKLHPETLAISHGFDPWLSEGAVKPPAFLTSTFAFKKAAEGKKFFAWLHGEGAPASKEEMGLVYSRINNPNLEIFEDRICVWEGMERALSFSSGMAAISTALLATHNPGDEIIACMPIYGGTDTFMHEFLTRFGITIKTVPAGPNAPEEVAKLITGNTRSIYIESPANPNNKLTDIEAMKTLAQKFSTTGHQIYVIVDNTLTGPVFCKPAKFGADIVIYSATKFIGGHSDIVAGVVLSNDKEVMKKIASHRSALGGMPNPYTAWLLTRSLETLKIRMEQAQFNAQKVAEYLVKHPKIAKVNYLGLLKESDPEYRIYKKQHTGAGSLLSVELKGGEKECFAFLDHLRIMKLAVSLGSTESLAQHPASMTHAAVSPEMKRIGGIVDSMVRISIGIENYQDLIWDLEQALNHV